jgi:hypothetical protein
LRWSGRPQNLNFNLVLLAEPRRWFDAVALLLLWELSQQQFDTLHSPG